MTLTQNGTLNMPQDQMKYDEMVNHALRDVVRQALKKVVLNGLPGQHHFYIGFATQFEGVQISEYLLDKYQTEMIIVVQNQYWDLDVHETGFEITLSFNKVMEHLTVPYAAITSFFDPSVQFGLKFTEEIHKYSNQVGSINPDKPEPATQKDKRDKISLSAAREEHKDDEKTDNKNNVVKLDNFRQD